jgi:uncharacterized protein
MRGEELSAAQARRIALAAQGFLDRRHAVPTVRTVMRAVERTQLLQVDSVSVLQRAHYLPVMSRAGPYETAILDRAAGHSPRRLVEYWAHVAAMMPVGLWPVMRHRMRHYRDHGHEWVRHRPELVTELLAEVRDRGAVTARSLDRGLPRSTEHWGWNWSESKKALEYLFVAGELAVAGRTASFERLYDLPERVLPADVLEAPEPSREAAERELVRRAARAHGVASTRCLADYFRMSIGSTRRAVRHLVEAGDLIPVRVQGWEATTYLHRGARHPRRVDTRALLCPFDPLVWERWRTERLFGFTYRIEIYVPARSRVHGYYVLPFLLGDRLVARVDLKADRRGGVLQVRAAHAEDHAPPETPEQLAGALREMAGWLGLGSVSVSGQGDLIPALRSVMTARSGAGPS